MRLTARLAHRAARRALPALPQAARELALALAARSTGGPALLPGPPPGPVLVIAPHPDDETVGAGATLARHAARGDAVTVLVATSGERTAGGRGDVRARREAECRAACADLGLSEPVFLRLPDGELRAHGRALTAAIAAHGAAAAAVYAPSPLDDHHDHRAANASLADAGLRAVVFGYEVWTAAPVDVLVDATAVYGRKERALRRYETALASVDYVRAARGLAAYRSIGGGLAGVGFAEGFVRLEAATHERLVARIGSSPV